MKYFLLSILFFITLGALAQEGPVLLMPKEDTVASEVPAMKSHLLPVTPFPNNDFLLNGLTFSFNPYIKLHQRFTPDFNFKSFTLSNFTSAYPLSSSPFFMNSQILSGSVTQLSDRLTIGGFSYGTNSIMSAPLPNQMGRSFDSYGSTMFMQYKVSKNFKIETRVSVGQSQGPLPPPRL